ncbi:MAG: SDR family oxidoreductase [Desulfatitalea sp.]|nr:SDR family oxidoreductase [Desulfatitalea sp.]
MIRASGGGSIINIGSRAGKMGHPTTAYAASKWGLRGLSKSAAMELVDWKIRVNTVHPGLIRTPIIDPNGILFKTMSGSTPMERAGEAEEMAAAVLFFASDESSFITGQDLAVDGGFSELTAYRSIWKSAQAAAKGQARQ